VRRVAFVVITASTLAACTLLTSLDDLTEGSSSPVVIPSEGGALDAGSEPSDPDGGVNRSDTGVEAAVPFCKSITGFAICADFDDTSAPPAPFDTTVLNGAANSLSYDALDSRSPPRSLLLVGGAPNGPNTATGLRWRTPTIATEVVAEFDFKAEQLGTKPFDMLNFVRSGYELSVEIAPSGQLEFDSQIPDPDGGVISGVVKLTANGSTSWQHLKWAAKRIAGNRFEIEVIVDNKLAGSTTISQTLFVGQPTIEVGDLSLETTTTPWKVRLDNFVLTVK